ncbi:mechanosensitive ion channel family protein [Chitinilyticum piscinae]|uniref:Mechanosensitive ion channel n=1 Tax=Chitinilyticum piscinae TaxID=2866724 RepID=A0A8J7FZP0_9NEIS|nr:mechanosensitive ion channel family protein [Chitinilyticum piscinae]MBE9609290.1 mechanosensitive ion channel [Chitinilyticum piscinae]
MWLSPFLIHPWPSLLGSGIMLFGILWWRDPQERGSLRLTLLLAGAGLAAYGSSNLWLEHGLGKAGALIPELLRLLLGMLYLRLIGLVLFRVLLPLLHYRPLRIAEDMALLAAYAVWLMLRLREAGLDLSQLVTTSAVMTAVLAFSMQDTLGNILSGIALQADQSLRLGQWVKAGEFSGRVSQIGWRSTQLETRSGETVVIPNGWLMKNAFVVLGRQVGEQSAWRRNIALELDAALAPARIIAVTEQALADTSIEGVASEPPPSTVLMGSQEGVAHYVVRYWLTRFQADDLTDSHVRAHLLAALGRQGIAPLARRQFELLNRQPDAQAQLSPTELHNRCAALQRIELFASLSEQERIQLAEELLYAPFEKGDVITRQGAVAHWLYILTFGTVEIWLDYGHPQARMLGTLGEGEIFGEMGMMTGAPRMATVVAASYVECYRLDRKGFQAILAARPELAESISQVLSHRQQANANHTAAASANAVSAHGELLARIRHFFGLD